MSWAELRHSITEIINQIRASQTLAASSIGKAWARMLFPSLYQCFQWTLDWMNEGRVIKWHQDFAVFIFWMIRKVARQAICRVVHRKTSLCMNFIENKDKKCPGARRNFSLLFCQTFRLNFRLFCANPCYSNINPGAFQNLSPPLSQPNLSLIANKSLIFWFLKSSVWTQKSEHY